jgi:hypothetical protein
MTETIESPPRPSRQEELQSALDAERVRQITWRVEVARYAHKMRVYFGGPGPCHEGTNDWLRARGVPRIPGRNSQFDEEHIRQQAVYDVPLPPAGADDTSAVLETRLSAFRAQGEAWRSGMIGYLSSERIDDYEIPAHLRKELISILKPESASSAPSAPLAVMRVRVITTHELDVPLTAFPSDYGQAQREQVAKERAAAAVATAVARLRLEHGATIASVKVTPSIPRTLRSRLIPGSDSDA